MEHYGALLFLNNTCPCPYPDESTPSNPASQKTSNIASRNRQLTLFKYIEGIFEVLRIFLCLMYFSSKYTCL